MIRGSLRILEFRYVIVNIWPRVRSLAAILAIGISLAAYAWAHDPPKPDPSSEDFNVRLGVPRGASVDQSIYQQAIAIYSDEQAHGDPALLAKFRDFRNRIAEAYICLSDPDSRELYNAALSFEENTGASAQRPAQAPLPPDLHATRQYQETQERVTLFETSIKKTMDDDVSDRSFLEKFVHAAALAKRRNSFGVGEVSSEHRIAVARLARKYVDAFFRERSPTPKDVLELVGILREERDQYFILERALARTSSPEDALTLTASAILRRTHGFWIAPYNERVNALIRVYQKRLFPDDKSPADVYRRIIDAVTSENEVARFVGDRQVELLVRLAEQVRYGEEPKVALGIIHHALGVPCCENPSSSLPSLIPYKPLKKKIPFVTGVKNNLPFLKDHLEQESRAILREHPELVEFARSLAPAKPSFIARCLMRFGRWRTRPKN